MPRKTALKIVAEDAPLPAPRKMTVRQAAAATERDLLVALRDRIAMEIDRGVPAHALAPLSRQLRDLAKEIDEIDGRDEGDEVGHAAEVPDEEWATS